MQYALQVFEAEDNFDFRIIDRNGEPWFILADVCRALLIANPRDASTRLDADEKDIVGITDAIGRIQNQTIVNESGLYKLIFTSRTEKAQTFKKWVTSVVLPQIRQTGSFHGKIPTFIARFNANADRVDAGHFSVINELVVRLWGRLEALGYRLPDTAPNGKELRPDVSVGKGFAKWLKDYHPEAANDHGTYIHWTPQADVPARQYPLRMIGLYLEYVDSVWIPECAEEYFRTRAPSALPYLPRLLPDPNKPKPGMMKRPTLSGYRKRKA